MQQRARGFIQPARPRGQRGGVWGGKRGGKESGGGRVRGRQRLRGGSFPPAEGRQWVAKTSTVRPVLSCSLANDGPRVVREAAMNAWRQVLALLVLSVGVAAADEPVRPNV